MNNKLNNLITTFLNNSDIENEEELDKKLQEFMEKYNNDELEYENTPLDDAYELLEKAENAKTKKQAIKLAKQAYAECSSCFDAILFQTDLEENTIKRMKMLNEGLEFEKKRLEEENYFAKDNIGCFYGIFETRPYIRGLRTKAEYLLEEGKLTQAKDICKEIIKLNEHDNTGARYLLMAIYATLEKEQEMLELYKKYPEENLEMLFPLFALYYKIGNEEKTKEYLKRVDKCNPNLVKFFRGTIKENEEMLQGYYSRGDSSEIFMYLTCYDFLLITMPKLHEYILDNFPKRKK